MEEGILQGLKPRFFCRLERAKPEGLAYLEARAASALGFDFSGQRSAISGQDEILRARSERLD
jgi:hypothetical protein